jgi:hypothetical protein
MYNEVCTIRAKYREIRIQTRWISIENNKTAIKFEEIL